MLRRLVLVGAGRAHLTVLRAFAGSLVRGAEIVLVSEETETYDHAMAAGLLSGAYTLDEARVDVAALADRAGARLLRGVASRIDRDERVVVTGDERLPFDVCSLDTVSWPEGADLPGVVDHALPLRPASAIAEVRASIDACVAAAQRSIDCVVVGAGTTGVETAFAIHRLLRKAQHGGIVTIVDGAGTILSDGSPCRDVAHRALERAGVCFALGSRVVEVTGARVLLASGASLPADLVLWSTSGAPPAAIAHGELPHDAHGRLLVDRSLRARDGSPVWAAGACASRDAQAGDRPTNEGALLEPSLRAALHGSVAPPARRRASESCLLDTADGRAIVEWGGVHARSRWGLWLKRRRDRRFVAELARP
ncbi:MAG TPA: FAD-dependent oxidoreductase [Gemmatimonadaceae bacterium]|nr:FAD-dependent oxidoreductase [Gemmatimonadaceae bacterium]